MIGRLSGALGSVVHQPLPRAPACLPAIPCVVGLHPPAVSTASLYMAVTMVVSGMNDYTDTIKHSAPLSYVFQATHLKWATYVINVVRVDAGCSPGCGVLPWGLAWCVSSMPTPRRL